MSTPLSTDALSEANRLALVELGRVFGPRLGHAPERLGKRHAQTVRELERLTLWAQEPIPIGQWLADEYYCDVAGNIYPEVARHLEAVFSGDPLSLGPGTGESPNGGRINEVCLCWGIGSGKSFLTSLATAYVLYRLGCMVDPATALGLAPRSTVVIANVSVDENNAREVVFKEIARRCEAPWFQEHFPPNERVRSELRFPKNVLVFPGNSRSTKVLGRNVLMGIIDEAAFHGEVQRSTRAYLTAESTTSYNAAVELYHALQERAQSRFGDRYLLMIVSSPLYPGDFIQEQLKRAALGAPGMYAGHAAQWDIKPASAYPTSEVFYVDPITCKIYPEIPEGFDGTVREWKR